MAVDKYISASNIFKPIAKNSFMADIIDRIMGITYNSISFCRNSLFSFLSGIIKVGIFYSLVHIVMLLLLVTLVGDKAIYLSTSVITITSEEEAKTVQDAWEAVKQNLPVFVLLLITFITTVVVTVVLMFINLNVIDDVANKKEIKILERFKSNFLTILLYIIPLTAIFYVISLIMSYIGASIFIGIITLIILFLIQFSPFELVVKQVGVINSLKNSISLVSRSPFFVLLFDILLLIITSIIYSIVNLFLFRISLNLFIGQITTIQQFVYVNVVDAIFSLIINSVTLLFVLPLFYFFWKNVSIEPQPQQTQQAQTQIIMKKSEKMQKPKKHNR